MSLTAKGGCVPAAPVSTTDPLDTLPLWAVRKLTRGPGQKYWFWAAD